MAIVLVLMVTAVSCTTMTGTQDEYYERGQTSNRVYVEDPYRGTVVLERDPYTGRYYEVNSYGSYNNRYPRVYNSNSYGRSYGSGSRSRNNDRYYRNDTRPSRPHQQAPNTEEQKREQKQNKDEARKKVLGG
jgi:hypothetical protein